MTWYLAVVVRGTFVDDSLHEERLADRLFCLIEAPDAEAAYRKSLELVEASTWDETFTDDDGKEAEMRAMGLADLCEIASPQLADGVEVYAEVLARKPSKALATEKSMLTVFEPAEIPEGEESSVDAADSAEGESEPEADPRFSDKTPIR
jgi:hypothetical protein